jgi:hypothetical protein
MRVTDPLGSPDGGRLGVKPVHPLVIPDVVKPSAIIVGPGWADVDGPAVCVGLGVGRAALTLVPDVGVAGAVSTAVAEGDAVG